MNIKPTDARRRTGNSIEGFGPTRRAILAAGGTVALSGLAGCSALDGLVDRAGAQVLGTTVSAPAAFYAGQVSPTVTTSDTHDRTEDEPRAFRTGRADVRHVPATIRAESRELELEGWSISAATQANDYNSVRSNKRRSEWWAGPDDDDDDDDENDVLVAILDAELALLNDVTAALTSSPP